MNAESMNAEIGDENFTEVTNNPDMKQDGNASVATQPSTTLIEQASSSSIELTEKVSSSLPSTLPAAKELSTMSNNKRSPSKERTEKHDLIQDETTSVHMQYSTNTVEQATISSIGLKIEKMSSSSPSTISASRETITRSNNETTSNNQENDVVKEPKEVADNPFKQPAWKSFWRWRG